MSEFTHKFLNTRDSASESVKSSGAFWKSQDTIYISIKQHEHLLTVLYFFVREINDFL